MLSNITLNSVLKLYQMLFVRPLLVCMFWKLDNRFKTDENHHVN